MKNLASRIKGLFVNIKMAEYGLLLALFAIIIFGAFAIFCGNGG